MVIHHIDMVILDVDMGYGLMLWEMTVSIWSSWTSIWISCHSALLAGKYSAMGPETQLGNETLANLVDNPYGPFTQVYTRYPAAAAGPGDRRYPVIVWNQGQGLVTIYAVPAPLL